MYTGESESLLLLPYRVQWNRTLHPLCNHSYMAQAKSKSGTNQNYQCFLSSHFYTTFNVPLGWQCWLDEPPLWSRLNNYWIECHGVSICLWFMKVCRKCLYAQMLLKRFCCACSSKLRWDLVRMRWHMNSVFVWQALTDLNTHQQLPFFVLFSSMLVMLGIKIESRRPECSSRWGK